MRLGTKTFITLRSLAILGSAYLIEYMSSSNDYLESLRPSLEYSTILILMSLLKPKFENWNKERLHNPVESPDWISSEKDTYKKNYYISYRAVGWKDKASLMLRDFVETGMTSLLLHIISSFVHPAPEDFKTDFYKYFLNLNTMLFTIIIVTPENTLRRVCERLVPEKLAPDYVVPPLALAFSNPVPLFFAKYADQPKYCSYMLTYDAARIAEYFCYVLSQCRAKSRDRTNSEAFPPQHLNTETKTWSNLFKKYFSRISCCSNEESTAMLPQP